MRFKRPTRTATVAIASAAAGMALAVPGLAVAGHTGRAVPPPPANPTRADQIQNIGQVTTAIKAYYGSKQFGVNPIDGTPLTQYDPNGAYAHEVKGIAASATKYLANHNKHTKGKAIVFDVDDTTLNTYSYEIYTSFVYNPTSNQAFVDAGSASVFPAVPGMVDLEKRAQAKGYKVFFLTGRPGSQRAGTVDNLVDAGYTGISQADSSNLYLKDYGTDTWLRPCATSCSTIQYKSLTRQHIESLGYDIVANFGDQYSDLIGGFANRTYKIPNPMYYLP
jgi:hypothetical protein